MIRTHFLAAVSLPARTHTHTHAHTLDVKLCFNLIYRIELQGTGENGEGEGPRQTETGGKVRE